jgi:signal transduction histidine kinase
MNPIREYRHEIMETWHKEVIAKIPVAATQTKLALYDSLPEFLENIAHLIDPQLSEENLELAGSKEGLIGKAHGQHRANANYSINQMIDEYFILKSVVFKILKKNGIKDHELLETIGQSFEMAIQTSAEQFSRSLIEAQESFVMGLTHDLRSPLMVIKLQSDMLKRGDDEKFKKMSDRISRSVSKIDKMIEDLLNSIRSQTHGMHYLEFSEIDVEKMIKAVLSDYLESKDNLIQYFGKGLKADWNELSMVRVVDNLISNALKYGDATRPVEVKLDGDEKFIQLSIHNFGTPIPPEELKNIFEKFKRSENSHHQKGWGIGLSLVKSVVEAHKGSVLVTSNEDGTTFKLEIPTHPA